MKLHPRVTQTAVDLAKRFEGFRPRAGKTPDARYTIGYGHILGSRDKPDQVEISEPEAEFLLKLDLSRVAEEVEMVLLAPVNDNQFAALLSFAFNIGVENFKGSSALRRLNEGAYLQAAAAIELWRRAEFDGETLVVDQLVRRRAVEKALFLAPPEGFTPVPSAILRPTFDHSVIGAAVAWAAARERTAVSRLALEGPEISGGLAIPPGREGEPAPSAAIAAADALTVRLSRILPEDVSEEEPAAPDEPPPPLVLEREAEQPAAPEPVFQPAARDTTLEMPSFLSGSSQPHVAPEIVPAPAHPEPEAPLSDANAETPAASEARTAETVANGAPSPASMPAQSFLGNPFGRSSLAWTPPAQNEEEPLVAADVEPTSPPLSFDRADAPVIDEMAAPVAESAVSAEPPPFVDPVDLALSSEPDFGAPSRPIGSRFARAFRAPATSPVEAAPSLFDPAPHATFEPSSESVEEPRAPFGVQSSAPVTPLFERPAFFVGLGLLGGALFCGSIFCMLHKASFGCLLIGVVGVLAMAPAAAFFLFRFLGAPVDPDHADHAAVLSAPHEEPAAEAAPAEEQAPAAASPFDRFPAE